MNDLQTLGFAAALYQKDPRYIAAMLAAVHAQRALAAGEPIPHEARPELRLNGLAYFRADDIAEAIGLLAEADANKARAEAAKEILT